ncbi:MAG: porin [Methylococcales bacterium]|nr:porin [Methylococcales bacterium]
MKKQQKRTHYRMIQVATSGLLLAGFIANAHAGAIADLTGYDANETSLFKNNGITVGGWVNTGITYNATGSEDKFNGPVTFGDRHSEVQLNQLNLFIQRAVATEGSSWDFGGRFETMFGTDSFYTQSYGSQAGHWDLNLLGNSNNRFYDLAMPQAYAEIYAPIGNGLNIKVGHFYTPIGYETVPAPDNFFYTHAYTMQFGEPFTHTGILLNYTVDDNWAVVGGALTGSQTGGWDGSFDKQLGNWGGLLGATWTSNDKGTSFNFSGTFSETSETNSAAWAMYSAVLKHNITDKTHLVLQHDHGFANRAAADGSDAEWYGVNTHLIYDVTDTVSAGVRGEWFRDQKGIRVGSPARTFANTNAASYYAVTAGVNWKPKAWLSVRPNVRYDFADGTDAAGGSYRPFGNAKQDQFLFSTDFTVTF